MASRLKPEEREYHQNFAELIPFIDRFSVKSPPLEELEKKGQPIILKQLAKYGVYRELTDLAPTHFVPYEHGQTVLQLLNYDAEEAQGVFALQIGRNIVFLPEEGLNSKNYIPFATTYFHENAHSLGRCIHLENSNPEDGYISTQVGYHRVKKFHDNWEMEWGEFLEESVVDYLGIEMTAELLEMPEIMLEIARLSGTQNYVIAFQVMEAIRNRDNETFRALIQARFDTKQLNRLQLRLKKEYGLGTLNRFSQMKLDDLTQATRLLRELQRTQKILR